MTERAESRAVLDELLVNMTQALVKLNQTVQTHNRALQDVAELLGKLNNRIERLEQCRYG
jgi:ABC-type transporter Mla subunit MlaD